MKKRRRLYSMGLGLGLDGDAMRVFVFGSNRQGRHGKGAALHALKNCGAVYGVAEGRMGNSYAIITKELRRDMPKVSLDEIAAGVRRFLEHAAEHFDDEFQVTPIGCGLAGFEPRQIAPMFDSAPKNVILPQQFTSSL